MSSDPPLPGPPGPGHNLPPAPAHLLPAPAHIGIMSTNSSNIRALSAAGVAALGRVAVIPPMVSGSGPSVTVEPHAIQPAPAHSSTTYSQLPPPLQPHIQPAHTMPTNYAQREYVEVDEPMEVQDMSRGDRVEHLPRVPPFGMKVFPINPVSQAPVASSVPSQQPLKVEDALNYLDQVKYKFGNQPQVYNQFLDIMKDFKSMKIDTPGVISRVSDLFHGHPELVVGFNAFLPAGYKIEMLGHGRNAEYILTGPQSLIEVSQTRIERIVEGEIPTQHQAVIQQNVTDAAPGRMSLGPLNLEAGSSGRAVESPPPPNLPSGNYETNPSPSFTHSFSSPFVQSAFPTFHSQPVEFNHAINYVSKIKTRFHEQPEKYKQFLEILHTYQNQKGQSAKDSAGKLLTEHEVYGQVSKLFEGQEDLLQEFSQFLPAATGEPSSGMKSAIDQAKKTSQPPPVKPAPRIAMSGKRMSLQEGHHHRKIKPAIAPTFVPDHHDIPLSEAEKYGNLNDFALFDKIRTALNSSSAYQSFLRVLFLYNSQVISKTEVLNLTQPFFMKHTKIFSYFKNFLMESGIDESEYEPPPRPAMLSRSDKLSTDDQFMEIDFASCRRLGASYCALPDNHVQPLCSGRTQREKEVLNDVWVSFPTWSEDSTFVTSRKTSYEEYIYRCEEERYELDAVIETNKAAIKTFNILEHRMAQMSRKELAAYKLDDTLGSNSQTICQRAIRRLYGDKAGEIIDAVKKSPALGVPLVLKRLKTKHTEWTEAQKDYNKVWREQMEKFYMKSLDHQGLTFKQSDIKILRPKALISEIESQLEERQDQESLSGEMTGPVVVGIPHLSLQYAETGVLVDACNLLLHHVRRQSGIHKEDKTKVKQILKHFMFDLFHRERLELSDEEAEDESQDEDGSNSSTEGGANNKHKKPAPGTPKKATAASRIKHDSRDSASSGSGSESNQDSAEKQKTSGKGHLSRRGQTKQRKPVRYGEKRKNGRSGKRSKHLKHGFKDLVAKIDTAITAVMTDNELLSAYNDFKELERKQELAAIENRNLLPSAGAAAAALMSTSASGADIADPDDEAYTLFYANRSWYIFFRLHHILCERLNRILETARKIIQEELEETGGKPRVPGPAVLLKLQRPREIEPEDHYTNFLEMIKNLLDGNLDGVTYEDTLRDRFGINAYITFTLDKVIVSAVRQLQSLVTDDKNVKCLELYHRFHKKGGAGGTASTSRDRIDLEIAYRKSVEKYCENDGCTRIVVCKNRSRINMELLCSDNIESATKTEEDAKLEFLTNILRSDTQNARLAREVVGLRPVVAQRNLGRKRKEQASNEHEYAARKYHAGNIPKYYRPKQSAADETPPSDVELDLLHNPENYEYLYEKDVMKMDSFLVPAEYASISPIVRNALLHAPKPKLFKRRGTPGSMKAAAGAAKFQRWHNEWSKKRTTAQQRKSVESWFTNGDGTSAGEIEVLKGVEVNAPEAPYRKVRKFVSQKEPESYAFPVQTKNGKGAKTQT